MYPDLFGISGFSMTLMIIIGVIAAIVIILLYLKKVTYNKLDLLVCILATVIVGIIFAIIFENIYEAIKHSLYGQPQKWTWGMTFFGGLIGGVATFLLVYKLYYLKGNKPIMKELLTIAPCALTAAHAFGRLGCFLSGCCYGIPTNQWFGIQFPGMTNKVIPTQLFEMAFLFGLSILLGVAAFKEITNYTAVIYLISYSVFRFLIEFVRGDERGQLNGLSPSQYICIALFIGGLVLWYFYSTKIFAKEQVHES